MSYPKVIGSRADHQLVSARLIPKNYRIPRNVVMLEDYLIPEIKI